MKIYLAGNLGYLPRERGLRQFLQKRLFSYFHILPGQIEHEVFAGVIKWQRKEDENMVCRSPRSWKSGRL